MLQPGMCSATWSLSSTCVGWPGAAATHAASQPSSGVRFGPPTAAAPLRCELVDQVRQPVRVGEAVGVGVGDDRAGGRPQADVPGRAQALVGLVDGAGPSGNRARIARVSSVEPSSTTITS